MVQLPSIPYPPSQEGYWSPVTATINWCEEDYYATIYSAEIVNTLTNLVFIYLAVRGLRNCLINDHESVFLVCFAGYGLVGLGSFAFHSTLKYPMQLWDELAMLYTTCLMTWAAFTWKQTTQFKVLLGVGLFALMVFVTGYYYYIQNPMFHEVVWGLLVLCVLSRAMWLMESRLRPAIRDEEEKRGLPKGSYKTLRTMWGMIGYGLVIILFGWAYWNIDIHYCSWLRAARKEIGLPWGLLLEGHGWWHIGTGYGAYVIIVWGIWLRHNLNGDGDRYRLDWSSIWSIPDVVRVSAEHANGKKNE